MIISFSSDFHDIVEGCAPTIDACGKSILMVLREYEDGDDGKRILSCKLGCTTRYYRANESAEDVIEAFVKLCKKVKCDMFNYVACKNSDGNIAVRAEFHTFLNGKVGTMYV